MTSSLRQHYETIGVGHKTHYDYFKIFKDQIPKSGKILDLGCGDGVLLSILKTAGYEAIGLEIAQSFVDRAKIHSNCEVFLGSAEKMDMFEDDEFDCVISTEVLEHTISPYKSLIEINRILKSEGTAIISSQNPHHIVRIIRPLNMVKGEIANRHLHCLDLTQWITLFILCGFNLVSYRGWPDNWIFPRFKGIGKILDKIFQNQERFKRQIFYHIKKQEKSHYD